MSEDAWHSHCGRVTASVVGRRLATNSTSSTLLLNAGSGVYAVTELRWRELVLDLFAAPLRGRRDAVCGSIEALPFRSRQFGAVVCVGEVLAYCDPATALTEFARTLAPAGVLVIDFRSTRSARCWLRSSYGRAVDLVTDEYNGEPELTWIYDPRYIERLLEKTGFLVREVLGTHTWSSIARSLGLTSSSATRIEQSLYPLALLQGCADLITIVAERTAT